MHLSQIFVGFELLCKNHPHQFTWAQVIVGFPLRPSSLCAHEANTGLTGDRGDAGGQVLLEGVLVRLWLLRLWQDVVARVGQVGDLHLLCLRRLRLVQALRVTALLRLHPGPDALPPPEDQRHSVTDGLGHDLEIVLMEKARVNLQRNTHLARSWARGWHAHKHTHNTGTSSQQRKHPFETTWIYINLFLTRTGTQELDGVGFFLSKISIPNALKKPKI